MGPGLRDTKSICGEVDMISIRDILVEMRVRQYTKNLFVLAAPLFAGVLFVPIVAERVTLAFIAFSLVASSVYVLNDILAREKDRVHPVKCRRPIAAGIITLPVAFCVFGGAYSPL